MGDGHNPRNGNAQHKSNVLGKVLRIDPLDPALTTGSPDPISANGKYRIPRTNPFVFEADRLRSLCGVEKSFPLRF